MKGKLTTTLLLGSLLMGCTAQAAEISQEQARIVAENWLKSSKSSADMTFEPPANARVQGVFEMKEPGNGTAGYYFVQLEPAGWALVPADDAYEPIFAAGDGDVSKDTFVDSIWYRTFKINKKPEMPQNPASITRQQWEALLPGWKDDATEKTDAP